MDSTTVHELTTLMNAIFLQQQVELTYKNQDKSRIVNPHNLYLNKKQEIQLDAYQVSGETESKKLYQFKQFNVNLITNVKILEGNYFDIDTTYNPTSERYNNSIQRVETNGVKLNEKIHC